MIADIRLKDNLFGLSYFNLSESDGDIPEPGSFGCIAELKEIETMPDGRSNILTVGITRYKLLGYIESETPYMMGEVETFEDDDEDEIELAKINDTVFGLFNRIAQAAHDISGARGSLPELAKADPKTLSFMIASAFNLDLENKLKLLKTRSTSGRLRSLEKLLSQALGKMEDSAHIHKISKTNGHSKKKIDLD